MIVVRLRLTENNVDLYSMNKKRLKTIKDFHNVIYS